MELKYNNDKIVIITLADEKRVYVYRQVLLTMIQSVEEKKCWNDVNGGDGKLEKQ